MRYKQDDEAIPIASRSQSKNENSVVLLKPHKCLDHWIFFHYILCTLSRTSDKQEAPLIPPLAAMLYLSETLDVILAEL